MDDLAVNARLADLASILGGYRFRFADEKELQDRIEEVLGERAVAFVREHYLGPRDTVDFLVGGEIALEVKVGGGLSDVTRQLSRYAAHEAVRATLLVSTLARLDRLPSDLGGKPCRVVVLPGGLI